MLGDDSGRACARRGLVKNTPSEECGSQRIWRASKIGAPVAESGQPHRRARPRHHHRRQVIPSSPGSGAARYSRSRSKHMYLGHLVHRTARQSRPRAPERPWTSGHRSSRRFSWSRVRPNVPRETHRRRPASARSSPAPQSMANRYCRRHRPATIRYRRPCLQALPRYLPHHPISRQTFTSRQNGFAFASIGLACRPCPTIFRPCRPRTTRIATRSLRTEHRVHGGVRLALGGKDALGSGDPIGPLDIRRPRPRYLIRPDVRPSTTRITRPCR